MDSNKEPAGQGWIARNGASMLTIKMYRSTDDLVYCDACSLRLIHTGVALSPVPTGTPCTCDVCGLKSRAI